ncbi:MAG TPA: exosortase-associated EpsI family protein, partial [Tepidisphaeraceae bacterium]|nr:exosortase-associated EpsI family protein [Tepidisphaeraceae bacterium]
GMSLCLLGGATVDRSFRTEPADTAPYHERIVKVADASPMRIGNWIGTNVATPEAAIKLLRPNVIVSKRYINYVTGEWANFLLVDCSDARDLQGHYPPICYPNQGWLEMSHAPRDWHVGDLTLTGTQYEFMTKVPAEMSETIANFMLLPGGKIGRDMDSVIDAAKNLQTRYYGAAQVQVIMDSSLSQERKDQIVDRLVGGYQNLINVIIRGDK